jgi:hypothetical protein
MKWTPRVLQLIENCPYCRFSLTDGILSHVIAQDCGQTSQRKDANARVRAHALPVAPRLHYSACGARV